MPSFPHSMTTHLGKILTRPICAGGDWVAMPPDELGLVRPNLEAEGRCFVPEVETRGHRGQWGACDEDVVQDGEGLDGKRGKSRLE